MKKSILLVLIPFLGLSSCTVEEDSLLTEESAGKLFEKVTVARDASGAYSLDIKLGDGIGADIVDSYDFEGKEINFFNSNNELEKRLSEKLTSNAQEEFKIGINADNKSFLRIKDSDIKFDRSSEEDHLESYSVTDNGDGTYDLGFRVDPNVAVEFIQNEDTGVYEIHLEPGNGEQPDFLRTFTKDPEEELKITFVNYFHSEARDGISISERERKEKPRVIIDDGGGIGPDGEDRY